jgi:hypothetical protein
MTCATTSSPTGLDSYRTFSREGEKGEGAYLLYIIKAVGSRESLRPYGFGNTFGVLGPGSGVESNVPMPPLSSVGVTLPKLTTGVPGVMRWWTVPPNDGAPEAIAERPGTLPAMKAAAPAKYPKRLVTF